MEENFYIDKCLELIEEKLQWGKSKYWTLDNFRRLSEEIHQSSKITISTHTLKRLFGKLKTYRTYSPQSETKKALALFLGYRDWEEFKRNQTKTTTAGPLREQIEPATETPVDRVDDTPLEADAPMVEAGQAGRRIRRNLSPLLARRTAILAGSTGLVLLLLLILFSYRSGKSVSPRVIPAFTVANTRGQVPITTVFHYDLANITADSVFIDLDNKTGKVLLPPDKKSYHHTYMFPNLYRAKLIAAGEVLATKNIHVLSNGWRGIIYYGQETFHVQHQQQMIRDGQLYVHPESLHLRGTYLSQYRNIREFEVDGNNFTLETRLKNGEAEGGSVCNYNAMEVRGNNRDIRFHVVTPGCTRWGSVEFGEIKYDGQFQDLSGLSLDLTQWHTLRLEVKQKRAQVFLNGKPTYSIAYRESIGPIKGIIFTFKAFGSVDYVKLYNDAGQLVYSDDFGGSH